MKMKPVSYAKIKCEILSRLNNNEEYKHTKDELLKNHPGCEIHFDPDLFSYILPLYDKMAASFGNEFSNPVIYEMAIDQFIASLRTGEIIPQIITHYEHMVIHSHHSNNNKIISKLINKK